jgi:hypothetical protein
MANKHHSCAEFIAAIPGTGGIITRIAEKVHCNWKTAYSWTHNKASVAAVYQAEVEKVLDTAEVNLLTFVIGDQKHGVLPDLSAIKFYLTTKGKHRGYSERVEVTGTDGKEITLRVIYGDDGRNSQTTQATPQATGVPPEQS